MPRTSVPGPSSKSAQIAGGLAALAALAALAGCGKNADLAKGKQLFTQRCGSCHTLADAGTKGTIGPNLDNAFKQSLADGLGRDTIEGVVREQIAVPQGGQMPANLVRGDDAKSVAAYVAEVAGKGGGGNAQTTPGATAPGGPAKANSRNQVAIPTDKTGQLKFQVASATAKAGKVTLRSKNDAPIPHDISIKGNGVDEQGKQVSNGGTSKVTVTLKPGKYTFYCSVPGHEQGGMKGTLTVR
jgi:uncharacterized cupredoxin-like copper-binding protein